MKIALMIDEASLLRLEVFAELHTLTQFEQDSKPFLPIILSGQINLVDNLQYRNSLPLASRVIAKSHLKGIDLKTMDEYLFYFLNSIFFRISSIRLHSKLLESTYSEA